ncbi:hypothetical protein MUA30_11485 [Staphylococcus aureus]|nr:hypothetical protein [Staphylococcus aureus]UXT30079.1 hypothetical protein MUA67_11490 [Staphylococcus aureus]UXU15035.1 hypothetical protein MUA30_11485 [Staphylococcus aureus]
MFRFIYFGQLVVYSTTFIPKKDILQINDLECDINVKEPLKINYVVILGSGTEITFSQNLFRCSPTCTLL